jgi:hypothetical protein
MLCVIPYAPLYYAPVNDMKCIPLRLARSTTEQLSTIISVSACNKTRVYHQQTCLCLQVVARRGGGGV